MASRDVSGDVKVAAVVVTYNRKELLMECLEALMKQTRPLQAIYIIDNASTDGTPELLHQEGYSPSPEGGTLTLKTPENQEEIRVTHIRLPENTGGAGGFHEGVKRAYQDGYDWIWLMDDDAEPLPDSLEKLLVYASDDLSAICCAVLDSKNNISVNHRRYANLERIFPLIQTPLSKEMYEKKWVSIDTASFVGILINSNKIKKVGLPREEFFIHHDDIEYCLRLGTQGKLILVPGSVIIHKEDSKKDLSEKTFLGKPIYTVSLDKLWITYYGTRNLAYIGRNYSKNKLRFYMLLFKNLILSLAANMLLRDNKYRRIKFTICSYLDGIRGVFDNEKPKRILYSD